MHLIDFFS